MSENHTESPSEYQNVTIEKGLWIENDQETQEQTGIKGTFTTIVNNRVDIFGKKLPDLKIIRKLHTNGTVEEIIIDPLLYYPKTKEPIPWVSNKYERVNGRVEEDPRSPGRFILKFQERLKQSPTTPTNNSESK